MNSIVINDLTSEENAKHYSVGSNQNLNLEEVQQILGGSCHCNDVPLPIIIRKFPFPGLIVPFPLPVPLPGTWPRPCPPSPL